ncbi:hypothetical protein MTO96_030173 [Rhipicephalus appendiculatus]
MSWFHFGSGSGDVRTSSNQLVWIFAGQQRTKACGGSRCCRRPDAARPNATAFPGIAACSTPAACNNTAACPNGPRLCGEPAGHQRH